MPTSANSDDAARRRFWTERTESAYEFMFSHILPYPVQECGERLASLPDAARAAGVEVAFSERKHVLGLNREYFLREGQIRGFIGVAREMNERGWIMRVEDGFRTRTMQKHLGCKPEVFDAVLATLIWELDGAIPTPEFMFRRCSTMVATVPKFGTHMSASAIDISVLQRDRPEIEVDRGAPYLEMSALTPMDSPFISAGARANRQAILAIMRRHGFVEYPYEFWHFSSGDAYDQYLRQTGRPAIYGAIDWDPLTNTVTPFPNPNERLNSEEEFRAGIAAALARRRSRSSG